ncbi:tryptophan-rich sensory protein [Paracoccus sp. S1E-3]|uniref:tryptophan-rich sensory protein n=1 Tax=Paracoccus sp. S1E-3 TaxID=2756130 RepID=UPI0015EF7A1D|nr:tryptophan-rich sensory protein [Paracoccus sp. S1E-3]MBA4491601.1 tryptophan-rich sensory protein [Paracoccus sp. S1E-3]
MAVAILLLCILFALSPLASDGFNGFTPDQFPVVNSDWPIEPAGWAFSIWGLIYAWLIAGSVYGVWRARRSPDWLPMRAPLAASLGVGVFWIAAANWSPPLATLMIGVMLVGAVLALLRAGQDDSLWQRSPVGLYAGWLTAATGVAIGVLLSGYGLLGAQTAALVMLPFVLITAVAVQARRPDTPSYALAVAWALFGIMVDNATGGSGPVAIMAGAGMALMLGTLVWQRAR